MCLPAGWVQVALTHDRGEASLRGPLGGAASSLDAASSEPADGAARAAARAASLSWMRCFFVSGIATLMFGLRSLHSK